VNLIVTLIVDLLVLCLFCHGKLDYEYLYLEIFIAVFIISPRSIGDSIILVRCLLSLNYLVIAPVRFSVIGDDAGTYAIYIMDHRCYKNRTFA